VLGKHPGDGQTIALYSGRYGPYVKHGKVNATIPDKDAIDTFSLEEAITLLATKSKSPKKGKTARARKAA
jgi:topoisomerase IA-like protein